MNMWILFANFLSLTFDFRDAIMLFMYCPENARIKKKMIYSSSFDTVKRAFNGIKKAVNINDESDLNEEFVKEKAMEGLRV